MVGCESLFSSIRLHNFYLAFSSCFCPPFYCVPFQESLYVESKDEPKNPRSGVRFGLGWLESLLAALSPSLGEEGGVQFWDISSWSFHPSQGWWEPLWQASAPWKNHVLLLVCQHSYKHLALMLLPIVQLERMDWGFPCIQILSSMGLVCFLLFWTREG